MVQLQVKADFIRQPLLDARNQLHRPGFQQVRIARLGTQLARLGRLAIDTGGPLQHRLGPQFPPRRQAGVDVEQVAALGGRRRAVELFGRQERQRRRLKPHARHQLESLKRREFSLDVGRNGIDGPARREGLLRPLHPRKYPRKGANLQRQRHRKRRAEGLPQIVNARAHDDVLGDVPLQLVTHAPIPGVDADGDAGLGAAGVTGVVGVDGDASQARIGLQAVGQPRRQLPIPTAHQSMKRGVEADGETSAAGISRQDLEVVVGTEGEHAERHVGHGARLDLGLVIPVDRGGDDGLTRTQERVEHNGQQGVDVAAAGGGGEGDRGQVPHLDRAGKEEAGVDQVEVTVPATPPQLEFSGADVDDAGGGAAVIGAKAARIKRDVLEELGIDHRGQPTKVIEERNLDAVEVGARVGGVGAAHNQGAAGERRARQARQVLDDADGVAEGTRHALDLVTGQADLGDVLLGPTTTNHHLELRGLAGLQVDDDLGPFAGGELLVRK